MSESAALKIKNCIWSLTKVTVVKFVWLHPDSGTRADVDAETNHVIQLKV